jgi:prepilin-type N-terminal cleavage/methylation domain-containing protein
MSRRAFTMIELLIVIGIIVLMLAIVVPVISALQGSNVQASAQNQIASALGSARTDAMYNRQITGVMFFPDVNTMQVYMVEVQAQPQAGGGNTFLPGSPNPNGTIPITALEIVNHWDPTLTPPQYVYDREVIALPKGVGLALYNDQQSQTTLDRYIRVGVILFDPHGSVISLPWGVPSANYAPNATTPANQLNNAYLERNFGTTPIPDFAGQVPKYTLNSNVGFALYDLDAYRSARAGPGTTPGDDGASFSTLKNGDLEIVRPNQPIPNGGAALYDKQDVELWIDQNSTAYVVSPFSGALIKGK